MLGLASCIARTLHAAVLLLMFSMLLLVMFLLVNEINEQENFVMWSPIFPQDC